jgi:hypothetical protein
MRYDTNIIKKTSDGKEAYIPKILPTIYPSSYDLFIATETGDRLDTLSSQFYKNPHLWWIIAAANNIHTAPIGFADGTILRIPTNYQEILNETMR